MSDSKPGAVGKITDEEFSALVAGLRFAGPDVDLGKLFLRTCMGDDGLRREVVCQKCRQNIWEQRDGKFYCWNCAE